MYDFSEVYMRKSEKPSQISGNCTLQLYPTAAPLPCRVGSILPDWLTAAKHLPKSVSQPQCVLGARCGSGCYICHTEYSVSASEARVTNVLTAHDT